MNQIYDFLAPFIPDDHSRQVTSREVLTTWLSANRPVDVMDLGCGVGNSVDVFRSINSAVQWTGLDIEDSPEVNSRRREDARFLSYDGVSFPLPDESFDLIYSHQVFEHVRHPEKVLAEVFRTLRPGGVFIGSTSQLEPYHSHSFWNYTVYGFATLLSEAQLRLVELRPGIDGITLIQRSMASDRTTFGKFFSSESPMNARIEESAKNKRPRIRNFRKLLISGHFVFRAYRPAA